MLTMLIIFGVLAVLIALMLLLDWRSANQQKAALNAGGPVTDFDPSADALTNELILMQQASSLRNGTSYF